MFFIIIILIFTALYLYCFSFIDLSYYFYFLWTPASIALAILTTILLGLLYISLCPTKNYKNKFKHFILWSFCDLALRLSHTKVEVIGKDNLPKNQNYVVMANHKSRMDPVMVYYGLHTVCSAVGKKSLFAFWPMTKLARIYKAIALDRDNDREAVKQIIEAIKYVKNGYPMIIFPEGGIKTRDVEEMVNLRAGAYKVPLKANAGVIPISIIGSSKFHKKSLFKKLKVKLIIHPFVTYDEIKDLNTTAIGEMIEEIVNEGIKNEAK